MALGSYAFARPHRARIFVGQAASLPAPQWKRSREGKPAACPTSGCGKLAVCLTFGWKGKLAACPTFGPAGSGTWRPVLLGFLALTVCSCQANVSDEPTRAAPGSAIVTAASVDTPAVDAGAGPSDSGLKAVSDAEQEEPAEGEEGCSPADPASEPEEAQSQTTAGAGAEYPLQENPLAGCTLCHVDVEDQFIGTLHFEEKVGCSTCHGPSEGHLADENNEVKPDEVFARADVDRLCGRCHECPRPVSKEPELTAQRQAKVCVDCHGPHDLVLADEAGPSGQ